MVSGHLEALGLRSFGWFQPDDDGEGLLIGDAGGSHWSAFATSGYLDGDPDPLNRWTRASLEPLAQTLNADIRYPFGEELWPFQRWAMQATGAKPSPIGLLLHPEFGLWWALRGALIFDRQSADALPRLTGDQPHACDTCLEKPCLTTCPVEAFTVGHYDVIACRAHVASPEGVDCRVHGCRARRACPVGRDHTYPDGLQSFLMQAFTGSAWEEG